jgi:putative ABC transport system substrate-binding protein
MGIFLRRREFIAGLGGAAAWPLAVRAQQDGRVRRVGVLMNAAATEVKLQGNLAAFVQEMRRLGWSEGQNLRLDVRWNAGDAVLLRTYAAELIGLMPDVIVTESTVSLAAVEQATKTIPIVFVVVNDPVTQGVRIEHSAAGRKCHRLARTNFHSAANGSIC